MVTITVILHKSARQLEFEEYYFSVHLPLVEQLPNVKNVSVERTFNVQNFPHEVSFVARFSFENEEIMNASLDSLEGQALYADVPKLVEYLPSLPIMLFTNEIHL